MSKTANTILTVLRGDEVGDDNEDEDDDDDDGFGEDDDSE